MVKPSWRPSGMNAAAPHVEQQVFAGIEAGQGDLGLGAQDIALPRIGELVEMSPAPLQGEDAPVDGVVERSHRGGVGQIEEGQILDRIESAGEGIVEHLPVEMV
jgi:hypothetical protein